MKKLSYCENLKKSGGGEWEWEGVQDRCEQKIEELKFLWKKNRGRGVRADVS